ncbi:hypothetical protein [Mesorhizobium sp.]|uniref:hypothetical protein n=1 Tax=Mesorhizobium sp. TaxID=1871066 RepID=UPI0025C37E65|nr:hypothetical protein [Mesorhizobium sp.]
MSDLEFTVDCHSRRSISDSIERLIDMLDAMSPDPDLEPWLGAPEWRGQPNWTEAISTDGEDDAGENAETGDGDLEPNGDERDASATASWAKGGHWDENVEDENEHGGDILDEPHDDGIFSGCDNEPWLGWGNDTGQPGTDVESVKDVQDSPDYGCGGFTGEGKDMARQMLRTGRSRRPEPSLTIVGPVVTVPGWTGPLS